jgi:two-component system, chemotaxis family, sensor kinase CheA
MARDPYKYFRIEARDLAQQLGQSVLELEKEGSGGEVVGRLLRLAHTLKGAARVVRLPAIAEHAHKIEDLLSPFRDTVGAVPRDGIDTMLMLLDGIGAQLESLSLPEPASPEAAHPQSAAPVAVGADSGEIDRLIEGIAAATTELSALEALAESVAESRRLAAHLAEQLAVPGTARGVRAPLDRLQSQLTELERRLEYTRERTDRELRQVHDAADQLRLVPATMIFADLARAARDSAHLLNKEVVFETAGGDVRLDGQIVRRLQDALVQLVRNAVAHGIEVPRDRLQAGKPAAGRLTLRVIRSGRRILFQCEDDGRGIDVAALREAAARKGRAVPSGVDLDGDELVKLLLEGGLSTAPSVSEVAGRGVGMDVVRDAVQRLNASLSVSTTAGRGASFTLALPLSLSSVDALLLESSDLRASLPLPAVSRTVRVATANIHRTGEGEAILDEDQSIPLVALTEILGQEPKIRRPSAVSVVIVDTPAGRAAVAVGRIAGTGGTILRALPELAPAADVIAGASLDADGRTRLMLDPESIVVFARSRRGIGRPQEARKRPLLVIDDSLTTRMLEQNILESAGYEVDVAVSAEEGLERIRRRDYALILVDVEMPGMDGFGFIETIRRDPATEDIPAILVTSRAAPEDRRRGMDAGAQDYVVKSEFDQAVLLERIRELVN